MTSLVGVDDDDSAVVVMQPSDLEGLNEELRFFRGDMDRRCIDIVSWLLTFVGVVGPELLPEPKRLVDRTDF